MSSRAGLRQQRPARVTYGEMLSTGGTLSTPGADASGSVATSDSRSGWTSMSRLGRGTSGGGSRVRRTSQWFRLNSEPRVVRTTNDRGCMLGLTTAAGTHSSCILIRIRSPALAVSRVGPAFLSWYCFPMFVRSSKASLTRWRLYVLGKRLSTLTTGRLPRRRRPCSSSDGDGILLDIGVYLRAAKPFW